jgi:hypothetical protein
MDSLAELFPDGDFRFHLTLRRGEPRDFFANREATDRVRIERSRWLTSDVGRYAALLPEGLPLLEEFIELGSSWNVPLCLNKRAVKSTPPEEILATLGEAFEPDILFLSVDAEGQFRLRGGVLCFPTGWALDEKLGLTLDEIHGVVPGLNPTLGSSINTFLARLRPGVAFHRDNWGITSSKELNQHPSRGIRPPVLPIALDQLWLRVEHQVMMSLPRTKGVVFGIRIALHGFDTLLQDQAVVRGLVRALATMPAEMIRYKRIDAIQEALLQELRQV